MKMPGKFTVIAVLFVEIPLCAVIGYSLYKAGVRANNVLGARAIRLEKDRYSYGPHGPFTFFYEPQADAVWVDSEDWLPGKVTYTINHDTLNERYNYAVEKTADTFRILTLGDSFTFGVYVNTDKNYSELLEDALNGPGGCGNGKKFEVINLGVIGYDIGYTVERYSVRGVKYDPDLVIWFINPHNLLWLRDPITAREEEIKQAEGPDAEKKFEAQGDYYHATNQAATDILEKMGKDKMLKQQEDYLKTFAGLYHGPLLLVVDSVMSDPKLKGVIDRFVSSRANTWVDSGLPDLVSSGTSFPDGHPNAYGHSVIASHIDSVVRSQKLVPCTLRQ